MKSSRNLREKKDLISKRKQKSKFWFEKSKNTEKTKNIIKIKKVEFFADYII